VCVSLLTTAVVHNTAQNSSDNFPSHPPENHHWSVVVCWTARVIGQACSLSLPYTLISKWLPVDLLELPTFALPHTQPDSGREDPFPHPSPLDSITHPTFVDLATPRRVQGPGCSDYSSQHKFSASQKGIFCFFWTFSPHHCPSLHRQNGIAKQRKVKQKGHGFGPIFESNPGPRHL